LALLVCVILNAASAGAGAGAGSTVVQCCGAVGGVEPLVPAGPDHPRHRLPSACLHGPRRRLLVLRGGADGERHRQDVVATTRRGEDAWGPGGIFSTEVAAAAKRAKREDKMLLVRTVGG